MFELIYPDTDVPELPAPDVSSACKRAFHDAGNAAGPASRTEYFPVIGSNGVVIARATRAYCHSGVVHLHILDREGRLYLQKRSIKKDIQPGKWDTAVGGHVDYGESIMEALYRESSEELGFREYNPVWLRSYEFESEVEKELVNVFAAVGTFSLHPDLDEVDEVRGWTMQEIDENLGKSLFTPNFEGEFMKIRENLLSLL